MKDADSELGHGLRVSAVKAVGNANQSCFVVLLHTCSICNMFINLWEEKRVDEPYDEALLVAQFTLRRQQSLAGSW